ncbi:hypothetical protein SAMN02927937_02484 [Paenimyroides aquimaris]|uniref:DUF5018 domain-containing protein n=1 Tax=Paenimyroides marinum TaxID=1159016 RepID=A0A1H6MEJ0_9FLAO|nr:hypothetical protein [Paenimyroides aquimaris]SEH97430.1 hypothetical protein SAMN02927937_02484 [Paenimyroides aquimaris]
MKNKLILFAYLILGGVSLYSCTDEFSIYEDRKGEDVTEIITDQSKNKILSYKVTNPGEKHAIYSAIDNDAKTITVYLPAYYQLEFMEVAIELPQGTTISPTADELVPVFADTPFEYTVTAADGTTAKYTVNVVIQYPDMVLNERSTETVTAKIGISVEVTGINLLPSGAVTRLYLTNENGEKIWNYIMNEANSSTMRLSFAAANWTSEEYQTLSADKQTEYWLQLESYGITKRMELPVIFQ